MAYGKLSLEWTKCGKAPGGVPTLGVDKGFYSAKDGTNLAVCKPQITNICRGIMYFTYLTKLGEINVVLFQTMKSFSLIPFYYVY